MSTYTDYTDESLRQNLFWLHIMQEHAQFIRGNLPCDAVDLIAEALQLENCFKTLEKEALEIKKDPSEQKVDRLNTQAIDLTTNIIFYKSKVLKLVVCCSLTTGHNFPLFLDHTRREALNFRTNLIRLQNRIPIAPPQMLIEDEIFFLRIFADHSKFIAGMLDPSERRYVNLAQEYSRRFDDLYRQSEDLGSILVPIITENLCYEEPNEFTQIQALQTGGYPAPFTIGTLSRFTDETIANTNSLLKYKQATRNLIKNCKILSIIPLPLIEHVIREAEWAIAEFTHQKSVLPEPCSDYIDPDTDSKQM